MDVKREIMVPVGEENFEKIRTCGFYYIDKTKFIVELLQKPSTVHLITRPRRFGKTLMMNMLMNFFDIRRDSGGIFGGLEVSGHGDVCGEWMNKWPVLFISLKDVARLEFSESMDQLAFNISSLCVEHEYLRHSDKVSESDKEKFENLWKETATKAQIENSLLLLTRMMYAHYGKQVILLIDEYDVPLAKAHEYGYYRKMLDVVRGMMGTAFKTNNYLKFAVVTGCLQIAKESIFTGVNHFKVNSIAGGQFPDCFGFTEPEVLGILADAGLESCAAGVKQWYNGYRFGSHDIYCPWDVINYVADAVDEPDRKPGNYWKDTSHNDIIRSFVGRKDIHVNDQFETLLAGGYVRTALREGLTYDLENATEEDFWNILYQTGYLTSAQEGNGCPVELENGGICLKIPNEEVKTIFADTIVEWFRDTMKGTDRGPLFAAWWGGKDGQLTELVTDVLFKTISYYDYKEDYYHAFVAGLFVGAGYHVVSNREYGTGRPDIVVKDRENRRAIIIETKHSAGERQMEKDCGEALAQIDARQYAREFLKGYRVVLCYGIAFFEKSCLIKRFVLPEERGKTRA